ncbi:MAG: anaerobic ribonucleoside-triphosphate reductase activating protein [DPANN group archaeon]|nr:anaerobic ribonucleoside-triphosphate reductase activating protein [DPANN group archaeon]
MSSVTEELEISGFLETSFVDWDGFITSVIFLPGCNLRCPFCHNHELIFSDKSPDDMKINSQLVLDHLKYKTKWIDGLTVTGGEPTFHMTTLVPFLETIKQMGLKVKLDTNGSNPYALKKLIDMSLVDYFAMDVKTRLNDSEYHKATGVDISVDKIRESIRLIINSGVNHEFRTTVVPTLVSVSDLVSIAKDLNGCRLYVLQKFHNENAWKEPFKSLVSYTDDEMKVMGDAIPRSVTVKLRLR